MPGVQLKKLLEIKCHVVEKKTVASRYGGFLSHRGTPSHHPAIGIFHEIQTIHVVVAPFMEPPIHGCSWVLLVRTSEIGWTLFMQSSDMMDSTQMMGHKKHHMIILWDAPVFGIETKLVSYPWVGGKKFSKAMSFIPFYLMNFYPMPADVPFRCEVPGVYARCPTGFSSFPDVERQGYKSWSLCMCLSVGQSVWMCGCMHVWMHECMSTWMHLCMNGCMGACLLVYMNGCVHVCMYLSLYLSMYLSYVSIYVSI